MNQLEQQMTNTCVSLNSQLFHSTQVIIEEKYLFYWDLHVLVKQDQAEHSKNKTEKKVFTYKIFFFIEVRREFSNWLWTWVVPWAENTGSWPWRDRTTEPKCLYRSLGSESGIQEVKQELLEEQQTHFPLYLLSYVNKSVGEVQIFIDSIEQDKCIFSWYELSVLQLSEFTGSHSYISRVFHPHAKNLIQNDS